MLHHAKHLSGYDLKCHDGDIGSVKEFYFDDEHWTIRYLVVNTGLWLFGRKVLISPQGIRSVDQNGEHIAIDLTKQQIEDSPPLESDQPVSRQYQESYLRYYGWSSYWGTSSMLGMSPYFGVPLGVGGHRLGDSTADSSYLDPNRGKPEPDDTVDPTMIQEPPHDLHLRSTDEVSGYDLVAEDGEIGTIKDFIIDDTTWQIRYLVAETGSWWSGKRILIAPSWVADIRWSDGKVFIRKSRDEIKQAPEFLDIASLTPDFEEQLRQHYQSPSAS